MGFQISLMMFVTWLEGLICPAIAINTAVAREKKEKALRFKLRKKKGIMELGYKYCHVGINWLTTCQTIMIQHLFAKIGKGIVFLRL